MNYFNYFSEIEETFIRRRGRNLLLSPLDWALIETWQERGVPLHIVLRGIEKIFDQYDQKPTARRTIKSLMYCREEIEAQYAEWLESQVGRNGLEEDREAAVKSPVPDKTSAENPLFPKEVVAGHLEKIAAELSAAVRETGGELRDVLVTVGNRLARAAVEKHDPEKLEEILVALDSLIDRVLLNSEAAGKLENEIKKQITGYQIRMEADVYQRTFELMLSKRLRQQHRIPRLSLFYL